jgi:hypothetical protein
MNTPKFYYTKKILRKVQIMSKKCRAAVSYEDVPFTEKPDTSSDSENRIDPHSLFSMFTANMIKEKVKWFR